MKQLKCELCGGTNLVKQDGMFVCQDCQTKYTVEEAKKMMLDSGDSEDPIAVEVDTSKELQNLYVLARRAREDGNSEKAEEYYNQILMKDASSWEAYFYTTYFQSMNCKIGEIKSAAIRICNCEDTTFNLIKDTISDKQEQKRIVDEVATRLIKISSMLFNSYKSYYDGISYTVRANFMQKYVNACYVSTEIVYNGGFG